MAQAFPVFLYNKDGAVITCDNLAALNIAKEKGYRPGYVASSFPKMIFDKNGEQHTVSSQVELDMKLAIGWSEDYVAKPEAKAAVAGTANLSVESATIQAIFAEISDLKRRLDSMENQKPAQSIPPPPVQRPANSAQQPQAVKQPETKVG